MALRGEDGAGALADLSIEQLMSESVSSASKKEERIGDVTAAISMLTGEDLRRSGATSVMEGLRLVPGMGVEQVDAGHWSISSRGFNDEANNKLLVLLDGRSLNSVARGGVDWGAQDLVMEDLARVEVIRGPGATLWGLNAVNGVVSLTSKSAKETQGSLTSLSMGSGGNESALARYGGRVGAGGYFRVYANASQRGGLPTESAQGGADWRTERTGFRVDETLPSGDSLTVQGDLYATRLGDTQSDSAAPASGTTQVERGHGANLQARWTRTLNEGSQLSVQAYGDEIATRDETDRIADLQFEHRFVWGQRQDLLWGGNLRHTAVDLEPVAMDLQAYLPETGTSASVFLEDDITVVMRRLRLKVGGKLDYQEASGWSFLPSARLLWTPSYRQTVWASVARAMSRPTLPQASSDLSGVSSTQPEEALMALELGYRLELSPSLSGDVAVFRNVYHNLAGAAVQPAAPGGPNPTQQFVWRNDLEGRSYGGECAVQWRPIANWRLRAQYSRLILSTDPDTPQAHNSPAWQAGLRSLLDLSHGWEFTAATYLVGALSTVDAQGGSVEVPAYVRVDLGLTWSISPAWRVELWGRSLGDARHVEFAGGTSDTIAAVPRSLGVKLTWWF